MASYYAAFIKRKNLKNGDDTSDIASVSSKKSAVSATSNAVISSPESENITKAIVDNQGLMNKLRKETELRRQRQLEREETKKKEEEKRIEEELKKRKKIVQQGTRNTSAKSDKQQVHMAKQKVHFSVIDDEIPLNPPPKQESPNIMASTALFRVVERLADRSSVNATQVVNALQTFETKEEKLSPRTLKALEILDLHDQKNQMQEHQKMEVDISSPKRVRITDMSEPIMPKQLKFKVKPSKESEFGIVEDLAPKQMHHSPVKRVVKTNGLPSNTTQQQTSPVKSDAEVRILPKPSKIDYQFKVLTNLNEEKELETKSDQPIRSKPTVRRPWREPVNIPDRRPQTALSKEIIKLEDSIQKIDTLLKQKSHNTSEKKPTSNGTSVTTNTVPGAAVKMEIGQPIILDQMGTKLPRLQQGRAIPTLGNQQPQASTPIRLTEEALRAQNNFFAQESKRSVFDLVQKMQVPEFSIRKNAQQKSSLRNSIESMVSQAK